MEEFIKNPEKIPDAIESGKESKEEHEFTLEEIRNLLKMIDGKEHLDLAVGEQARNIKGELMSIIFTSSERETYEGIEYEISYYLTVAGQRYGKDGSKGRTVSVTSLTKDYSDYSKEVAEFINGEWVNLHRQDGE